MKIGAVIAEYNPFHNGHAYQLQTYKNRYKPDAVIAVMSEDFVQRGEPACTIYEDRVRAALSSGADVVIGLPVWFSTASAGVFASGGVSVLNACGCIDELFFGCDSAHETDLLLAEFQKAADLLSEESDIYKEALNKHLKQGKHFAYARAEALKACGLDISMFATPNNILALSYISALKNSRSKIHPVLIPRAGSGYHDLDTTTRFPSASAIRNVWQDIPSADALSRIPGVPEEAARIYSAHFKKNLPVTLSDFDGLFAMTLHRQADDLMKYADMSHDLANRISKYKSNYTGLPAFIDEITNKSLTKTRVSRACLHAMLDIEADLCKTTHVTDNTPYIRILGFHKSAAPVLKEISAHALVPVITKPSDYQKTLCGRGLTLFEKDIEASLLYRMAAQIKFKNPEIPHPFKSGVIILNS